MGQLTKVKKLEDNMRRKSPLKRGLKVTNEDDTYENYSKITSRIYLGNIDTAKNKKFFKDKKIKAVLNCTKDIKNYFCDNSKIEYMRIPIDDSLKEVDFRKMYDLLPVIVEFIYKHADLQKQNIYIHCMQGKARSCTAVVAYLMSKKKLNVTRACEYVMSKRPEAFFYGTSVNFSAPLVKYQEKLDKARKIKN